MSKTLFPRCVAVMNTFLKLICISALTAGLPAVASNVPLEYFGLHIHHADSGTAWPAVNFGSWRLWDASVQWTHLEPAKGAWQFGKLDKDVALAQAHGVSILLPLGLSPKWASARPSEHGAYGEGRAAEPASLQDWRTYVQTVAQRYKGKINTYEIWNEPNDKTLFSGTTQTLVALTCEAYKTLKAVDPGIMVAGPAYTGEGNVPKLEDFLAQGGSKCIDVVAYHLYVALSPPEAIVPLVQKIRQAMQRQGVGQLPLWNTESGWRMENTDGTPENGVPSYWIRVSHDQSAAFVARALLLASAYGVDRFYWYAWDNRTLGLIEPKSGQIKPGGTALGVTAHWMVGNPRPVCTSANGLWTCTLSSRADEQKLVVWSAKPGQYRVPAGWRIASSELANGQTSGALGGDSLGTDAMPRMIVLVPG